MELRKVHNKTPEELKELTQDIVQSRVFLLEHIAPDEMEITAMVFMPITFGALEGLDPESLGTVYEYLDKAGPRGVNGYPTFFSMNLLSRHDWNLIRPVIAKLYKNLEEIEIPTEEELDNGAEAAVRDSD